MDQASTEIQGRPTPTQAESPQPSVSGINRSIASQVPQTITISQALSEQGSSVSVQMNHLQQVLKEIFTNPIFQAFV